MNQRVIGGASELADVKNRNVIIDERAGVWIMLRSGTELEANAINFGEWAWIKAMTSGRAL